MEVEIKNFGPISRFETDLSADFLFIVGENNIGKSYAISVVYAVLKTLTANELLERPMYSGYILDEVVKKISADIKEEFVKNYKVEGGKVVNACDLSRAITSEFFRLLFLDQFVKSVAGTFGEIANLDNRRSKEGASIALKTQSLTAVLKIVSGKLVLDSIDVPVSLYFRPSKQRRLPKDAGDKRTLYGPADDVNAAIALIAYDSLKQFMGFVQDATANISDVHYLPASRSGLYQALSAFGQIIAELSKQRTFLSQRIELPAISEPLVDYFLKLTEVKPSRKNDESKFSLIADELDKSSFRFKLKGR